MMFLVILETIFGLSEKGVYDFSDVMRANGVYDVIYEVKLRHKREIFIY